VKNLFVRNLGSEVTPEELRRLFEAYGQVGQVHIVLDRDTGLPRGFAFVEMTNEAEGEKAIKALTGSDLRNGRERNLHLLHGWYILNLSWAADGNSLSVAAKSKSTILYCTH